MSRSEEAEARATSVRNLQALFAVVVGLALSAALEDVVHTQDGQLVLQGHSLALLGALIMTLVPFFHGAPPGSHVD